MDLGLRDKGILVGGGSRGLGRAVAVALAAEGARVLLTSRSEHVLREAVDAIGERADYIAADLSSPRGADVIAQAANERFENGLDGVLINHGGPRLGKALDVTDAQWLEAYQLVLGGPLRLLRRLRSKLRAGSSVVWTTSSSVRAPIPTLDTSNVLRPAVAALVNTLAIELGPGVRFNSIAPGRIDTERVRFLDEERAGADEISYEEYRTQMESMIPLARYGEVAEFARVATFLLSPASSYVSGTAVQVDGGLVRSIP
ncbi:MAG: SDR family oxidoreductase [Gaiellales bacterium]